MNNNANKNREKKRIKEIMNEYIKMGYEVISDKEKLNIPNLNKSYYPDLMVKNKNETVIIEVKSMNNMATSKKIEQIAKYVNDKKGWRFELVVSNPKRINLEVKNKKEYLINDIKIVIDDINKLINNKQYDAALVMAFSALEAASRIAIKKERANVNMKNTYASVKTLFSLGIINLQTYKQINNLLKTRNFIIHGYQHSNIKKESIRYLINTVNNLIEITNI